MNTTTSYKELVFNEINGFIGQVNRRLETVCDLRFYSKNEHIYERMKERDIDITELRKYLNIIYQSVLCRFLYVRYSDPTPLRINVIVEDVKFCFAQRDDNLWCFTTVINTTEENKTKTIKSSIASPVQPL